MRTSWLKTGLLSAGLVFCFAVSSPPARAEIEPEMVKKLLADGDWFGYSVSGDTAVIGVIYDDDNASNSGSVYVFNLGGTDSDDDNDAVLDTSDNCQLIANLWQDDNEGIADDTDNCQFSDNAEQSDTDGLGDVCDGDRDGDSVVNETDNCLDTPNALQEDNNDNNDGVADEQPDNCPFEANSGQEDLDDDNIGDICDLDIDGDGMKNAVDNCPVDANSSQSDNDDVGDACDLDDDNNGVVDNADNCPLTVLDPANPDQTDRDGDVCDNDRDNDGVVNNDDTCKFTILGDIIDPTNGCSLDQLCPCEGPRGINRGWKNHGKYVSCTAKSSESFVEQSLITETEKDEPIPLMLKLC